MRGTGHVACMGEMINPCRILFKKFEEKQPVVRPKYRWEDNTNLYLKQGKISNGLIWLRIRISGGFL